MTYLRAQKQVLKHLKIWGFFLNGKTREALRTAIDALIQCHNNSYKQNNGGQ